LTGSKVCNRVTEKGRPITHKESLGVERDTMPFGSNSVVQCKAGGRAMTENFLLQIIVFITFFFVLGGSSAFISSTFN